MTNGRKKYFDELNIFRALIIIWVIVGHSFNISITMPGFLTCYAYSFHMRAFFFLSGLLFVKKAKSITSLKEAGLAIKDRFLRLLVPYFFFTAVSFVLKLFLERYANNKLTVHGILSSLIGRENPNGGIWFLYAMFIINVFVILLYRLPHWAALLISAIMHGIWMYTPYMSYPLIEFIARYGVFFCIGLVLGRNYQKISETLLSFYQRKKALSTAFSILLLAVSVFLVRFYHSFSGQNPMLSFLLVLYLILTWYSAALTLTALQILKKPLMTVGKYGMDIYMIGYYVQITLRVILMSLLGLPYLAYAIPMCVCGLILPIPISKYFVRKFSITRALMLGDFKKEVKSNGEKA